MLISKMVMHAGGTSSVVDGYCAVHERLLTCAEFRQGVCWWCDPKGAPEMIGHGKDAKPHPLYRKTARQVAAILSDQRHDSHCKVHPRMANDL